MEIWRIIDDFGNYAVSNLGKIKSLERTDSRGCLIKEKILKPSSPYGYQIVVLRNNSRGYTKQVSRLVAKAFPEICGEWFDGCQVHHKDHNPQNNNVENLIVVTPKEHQEIHKKEENISHSTKASIFKYDLEWNLIDVYENPKMAAASVNGNAECLCKVLNKKTFYYYGYYFVAA